MTVLFYLWPAKLETMHASIIIERNESKEECRCSRFRAIEHEVSVPRNLLHKCKQNCFAHNPKFRNFKSSENGFSIDMARLPNLIAAINNARKYYY